MTFFATAIPVAEDTGAVRCTRCLEGGNVAGGRDLERLTNTDGVQDVQVLEISVLTIGFPELSWFRS